MRPKEIGLRINLMADLLHEGVLGVRVVWHSVVDEVTKQLNGGEAHCQFGIGIIAAKESFATAEPMRQIVRKKPAEFTYW